MPLIRLALLLLLTAGRAPAEKPAVRVVSLAPSLTQTLHHLGAEECLAGVTAFCRARAEVPRVAGGVLADPEAVLGLSPDLVLCTAMTPTAARHQMAKLGLRVEVIETPTLASISAATQRVAELVGVAAEVKEFPRAAADGPSVALLFGADTGYSAGCGSHAHEILEAAGLRNVAAEASGPWPQLGEEFLLSKDPEILIIADYGGGKSEEILAKLQAHPVRRHLRAVQNGKVVVFPAGVLSVPGPDALGAGPRMRAAIDAL